MMTNIKLNITRVLIKEHPYYYYYYFLNNILGEIY